MKGALPFLVIMVPCLFLLAGYGAFAATCDDGFCPGLLLEAAIGLVAVSAVVAFVASNLLRRGRGFWRSGAAAWATAVAAGALVFAGAQFFEGDPVPATFGLVVVAAASVFAWSAARSPRALEPRRV